jgi:hypothetical protein
MRDVNGDGVSDLLVGAPAQDVGGNLNQGQAFVFSGANGNLLSTFNDPTPEADANFGDAVAGLEDVSGDGTPDLLVGAPSQNVGGNLGQGQVFILSGADGTLLGTLDNPTPQAGSSFGDAVAGVGDVNGDSTPDLLVGAPFQKVGGNVAQGRAFVFVSTPIEVVVNILSASINPNGQGVIPVAILTTPEFNATSVNPLSVHFGSSGATEAHAQGHFEDVDGDGDTDLLLHFRTQETGIACGNTQASLIGKTFAGEPIHGADSFITVGCP